MSGPEWNPQQGYGQQPYGGPAQPPFVGQQFTGPPVTPDEERTWSLAAHLGQLVIGPLAPLITYLIYRDRSQFIRWHSAQALNFAITGVIYAIAVLILSFVTFGFGFLLYFPLGIIELIFMIMAGVAASRGEWYRYPTALAIPMVN